MTRGLAHIAGSGGSVSNKGLDVADGYDSVLGGGVGRVLDRCGRSFPGRVGGAAERCSMTLRWNFNDAVAICGRLSRRRLNLTGNRCTVHRRRRVIATNKVGTITISISSTLVATTRADEEVDLVLLFFGEVSVFHLKCREREGR